MLGIARFASAKYPWNDLGKVDGQNPSIRTGLLVMSDDMYVSGNIVFYAVQWFVARRTCADAR